MKMSNFVLSIIASLILGALLGISNLVRSQESTQEIVQEAVQEPIQEAAPAISVPIDDSIVGNGLTTAHINNLTDRQTENLTMAYEIAEKDGHEHPQLLQMILLQESLAGELKSFRIANPGKNAYFGLAQLKVSAAKDVLNRNPELFDTFNFHTKSDREIRAHLISDDKFNITIASGYLKILQVVYGFKGYELLRAYNKGPNASGSKNNNIVNRDSYVIKAKEKFDSSHLPVFSSNTI